MPASPHREPAKIARTDRKAMTDAAPVFPSTADELGVGEATAYGRQRRWLAENQAALTSSNKFVEEHGVPLARHRRF